MFGNNSTKGGVNKFAFLEFFLNIRVVLGLLALIFGITFYFKWKKKQEEEENNNNPKSENEVADSVKPVSTPQYVWDLIKNSTRDIAHHLGTKYPWYDPRGWTENDKEVVKVLKYQVQNLRHMETLYYLEYAKGKNLKADILKLLDSTQLAEVKEYYKSKGKTF